MEINGRFWGSLQLAVDAGVDFPHLLFRLSQGEDVPPQTEYRVGVRNRWLLGDLQSLAVALGKPDGAALKPKLRMCSEFFPLWECNGRFEDLRLDDLRPFLFELRVLLSKIANKLSGRERPSRAFRMESNQGGGWGNA
jgi:hypothetical protein